jgi:hypothetical protein
MKSNSLFERIFPCCRSDEPKNPAIDQLFGKGTVGILSASCCDPTSAPKDETLKANLSEAMDSLGDKRSVVFETITAAQWRLRTAKKYDDAEHQALAQNIMSLFHANGLSVFPMLIVDRQIVFYGGVPQASMIRERLRLPAA